MTIEDDIRQIFADNRKNEDRIAALLAYIGDDGRIDEAYPRNTHAEVSRAEVYELDLGIDANGHACRVTFPYGAIT